MKTQLFNALASRPVPKLKIQHQMDQNRDPVEKAKEWASCLQGLEDPVHRAALADGGLCTALAGPVINGRALISFVTCCTLLEKITVKIQSWVVNYFHNRIVGHYCTYPLIFSTIIRIAT